MEAGSSFLCFLKKTAQCQMRRKVKTPPQCWKTFPHPSGRHEHFLTQSLFLL